MVEMVLQEGTGAMECRGSKDQSDLWENEDQLGGHRGHLEFKEQGGQQDYVDLSDSRDLVLEELCTQGGERDLAQAILELNFSMLAKLVVLLLGTAEEGLTFCACLRIRSTAPTRLEFKVVDTSTVSSMSILLVELAPLLVMMVQHVLFAMFQHASL